MKMLSPHSLRRLLATTMLACIAGGAQASDTRQHAAAQQQLQRLSLEAALVDSSAFGQLRLLRDVEARTVAKHPSHSAGEASR